jgi:hypothetical protein
MLKAFFFLILSAAQTWKGKTGDKDKGHMKKSCVWWCTPIIPATRESGIGGMLFTASPGKNWVRPISTSGVERDGACLWSQLVHWCREKDCSLRLAQAKKQENWLGGCHPSYSGSWDWMDHGSKPNGPKFTTPHLNRKGREWEHVPVIPLTQEA